MGLKTVVNREILEVMDNDGLSLFPLMFINREVKKAKSDIEDNLLTVRGLDPKSVVIEPIKSMLRELQVRENYLKMRMKTYLN